MPGRRAPRPVRQRLRERAALAARRAEGRLSRPSALRRFRRAGVEVLFDERLDLRCARPSLQPGDDATAVDQHQRWHGRDAKLLGEIGPLVDVDRGHAQAVALPAGGGFLIGLAIDGWDEGAAGGVGGLLGVAGAAPLVAGALGRGGTRAATAVLVAGGGLALAALAF